MIKKFNLFCNDLLLKHRKSQKNKFRHVLYSFLRWCNEVSSDTIWTSWISKIHGQSWTTHVRVNFFFSSSIFKSKFEILLFKDPNSPMTLESSQLFHEFWVKATSSILFFIVSHISSQISSQMLWLGPLESRLNKWSASIYSTFPLISWTGKCIFWRQSSIASIQIIWLWFEKKYFSSMLKIWNNRIVGDKISHKLQERAFCFIIYILKILNITLLV